MKKADRQAIYDKCGGRCAYCGCEITLKQMHVDHVKPVVRESYFEYGKGYRKTGKMWNPQNDNFENILPACAPCNLWKHSMTLEDFRESVQTQIDKIQKASCGFRLLVRYGIVSVNPVSAEFYFEKMKRGENDNKDQGEAF